MMKKVTTKEEVDLGFIESAESHKLESIFFPSKVGGRPAWLDQSNIPNTSELQCKICGKTLRFLLQIYAPRDDIAACFHRTIYIFCCCNSDCFKGNSNSPFKVFRCQLARENEFFADEPFSEDTTESEVSFHMNLLREKWGGLCEVCGCPATNKCAACKTVFYCCKDHQTVAWKEGHKKECQKLKNNTGEKISTNYSVNFPEFELVTEAEANFSNSTEDENVNENVNMDEEQLSKVLSSDTNDFSKEQLALIKELEKKEDKQFQKFKKTIAKEPDQVLRYSYDGKPLWVSSHHVPDSSDIPDCSCGSRRVFEFQVLPQLLNHLKVDSLGKSIDWGTIAVYTCSSKCTSEQAYIHEFAWKQDFSESSI